MFISIPGMVIILLITLLAWLVGWFMGGGTL